MEMEMKMEKKNICLFSVCLVFAYKWTTKTMTTMMTMMTMKCLYTNEDLNIVTYTK